MPAGPIPSAPTEVEPGCAGRVGPRHHLLDLERLLETPADLRLTRPLGPGPPHPLPEGEDHDPRPTASDPRHLAHVRASATDRHAMEAPDVQHKIERSVDPELVEPRHVALGEDRSGRPVGLPPRRLDRDRRTVDPD